MFLDNTVDLLFGQPSHKQPDATKLETEPCP